MTHANSQQCYDIILSDTQMLYTLMQSVFLNNRRWMSVAGSSESHSDEIPVRAVPVENETAVVNLIISFYTLSKDMRQFSFEAWKDSVLGHLLDSWLDTMESLAWDLYREYVTIRGRSRLLFHGFSSGKKRAILGQSMESGEYAACIHCMVSDWMVLIFNSITHSSLPIRYHIAICFVWLFTTSAPNAMKESQFRKHRWGGYQTIQK